METRDIGPKEEQNLEQKIKTELGIHIELEKDELKTIQASLKIPNEYIKESNGDIKLLTSYGIIRIIFLDNAQLFKFIHPSSPHQEKLSELGWNCCYMLCQSIGKSLTAYFVAENSEVYLYHYRPSKSKNSNLGDGSIIINQYKYTDLIDAGTPPPLGFKKYLDTNDIKPFKSCEVKVKDCVTAFIDLCKDPFNYINFSEQPPEKNNGNKIKVIQSPID